MGKELQRKEKGFSVNILGFTYEVLFDNDITEPNVGVCDTRRMTITLRDDMDKDSTESTLLHEVIEAINQILGLELSHSQMCGLEVGIFGATKMR